MNSLHLPIQDIVEARSNELGVSRSELARRCGFKNINKGIRRINAVLCGDFDSLSAKMIFAALPTALKVNKIIISFALRESVDLIEREKRRIADKQDAERRASFKPNAWLLGTESKPRSIVIYGVTGGADRWLAIPLDCSQPPITFATQALKFVRRTPVVPFWGATTGFVINFTPDHGVRFDLSGGPIEVFSEAYYPGEVQIEMGNRRMVPAALAQLGFTR